MTGYFITLDGIDGAGKTTQLRAIESWFVKRHEPVLLTREPGGTDLGETIRSLLLNPKTLLSARTETLLMFAARQQHLEEVIMPALHAGTHVVCDRFSDATYAYQGGGRGLPLDDIKILEDWVQQGVQPHLTLIIDVALDTALARLNAVRDKDRFEQEEKEFFERVRQVYRMRATQSRCTLIDNSGSETATLEAIEAALNHLFAGQPDARLA